MTEKILIGKQDFLIGQRKYFVSKIPAVQAQRILMRAIASFSKGDGGGFNLGNLTPDILEELLSYAGCYNNGGAEVQFANEDIINQMVEDPMDLIEVEAKMVELNFGFFADGRINRVIENLMKALVPAVSEKPNA